MRKRLYSIIHERAIARKVDLLPKQVDSATAVNENYAFVNAGQGKYTVLSPSKIFVDHTWNMHD